MEVQLSTATPFSDLGSPCAIAPMERTFLVNPGEVYFIRLPVLLFGERECNYGSRVTFKSGLVTDECNLEPAVRTKLEELCIEQDRS